jgi:hypothetical protein
MRGQPLSQTASLSRNYAIDTGFGFDRRQLRRAWRLLLLKMNRRSLSKAPFCMAALAVLLALWPLSDALAQDQSPPPQGTSRGENFSAKPPAQLFASDCTGAGCHKGPQGLVKGQFPGSLASFLREHYTNSRESAAALAGYLSSIPRGAATEPRTPRSGKPAATATAPSSVLPTWGEGAESKPAPGEARPPRPIPGRTSRAAARPDEDPAATPPAAPVAAPPVVESHPSARAQRGRQPAPTAATAAAPVLMPLPEPEAAPAPPPPPPPPQPKQFDIFD